MCHFPNGKETILQNNTPEASSPTFRHHRTETWISWWDKLLAVTKKFTMSCQSRNFFLLLPSFAVPSSEPAALHRCGFLLLGVIWAVILIIGRRYDLTRVALHLFKLQRCSQSEDGIVCPDKKKNNEKNSGQWTIRLNCFLCNFPSVSEWQILYQ